MENWATNVITMERKIMSNYKILIIEDDKIIAESIKKHLEKWEYRVHCVTDFKEVISEVTTFKPGLILLDITLPFYNGFYWCNEIRKFTKIPIIFISSADDKMNIVMAMDMGGDDFISKPFDLTVLTAKIRHYYVFCVCFYFCFNF